MTLGEFLNIPLSEFNMKVGSIPESEPLYKIVQSRVININSIKDKEERKYWRNLKRINKIPNEYLSIDEINDNLKEALKENTNDRNKIR